MCVCVCVCVRAKVRTKQYMTQIQVYKIMEIHDIYIYMGSSSVLVLVRGNQRSKLKSLTACPN